MVGTVSAGFDLLAMGGSICRGISIDYCTGNKSGSTYIDNIASTRSLNLTTVGTLVSRPAVSHPVDNGGTIVGYRTWGGEGEVLLAFWPVSVSVFCESSW